jgi:hypothetical protein
MRILGSSLYSVEAAPCPRFGRRQGSGIEQPVNKESWARGCSRGLAGNNGRSPIFRLRINDGEAVYP